MAKTIQTDHPGCLTHPYQSPKGPVTLQVKLAASQLSVANCGPRRCVDGDKSRLGRGALGKTTAASTVGLGAQPRSEVRQTGAAARAS